LENYVAVVVTLELRHGVHQLDWNEPAATNALVEDEAIQAIWG